MFEGVPVVAAAVCAFYAVNVFVPAVAVCPICAGAGIAARNNKKNKKGTKICQPPASHSRYAHARS